MVKDKEILLKKGNSGKSDINLQISTRDLEQMIQGKTTGNKLFMQGKIKVEGDMSKAAMLDDLVKEIRKTSVDSKI